MLLNKSPNAGLRRPCDSLEEKGETYQAPAASGERKSQMFLSEKKKQLDPPTTRRPEEGSVSSLNITASHTSMWRKSF